MEAVTHPHTGPGDLVRTGTHEYLGRNGRLAHGGMAMWQEVTGIRAEWRGTSSLD